MQVIESFSGPYRFLSNFYPSYFKLHGIIFPSVEHYYQANKAQSNEEFMKIVAAKTPGEAKKLGQLTGIDPKKWDRVKYAIMYQGVHAKFEQNPTLLKLLLETGDAEIIEGNTWGDEYWGVCNGLNKLGELLMEVRECFLKT